MAGPTFKLPELKSTSATRRAKDTARREIGAVVALLSVKSGQTAESTLAQLQKAVRTQARLTSGGIIALKQKIVAHGGLISNARVLGAAEATRKKISGSSSSPAPSPSRVPTPRGIPTVTPTPPPKMPSGFYRPGAKK
jgi:hypothetical protein